MSSFAVLKLEYGACVEALGEALKSEDEAAFFSAVDHIVRMHEPKTITAIRKLTGDLQQALERFSIESRLADIAENGIPDAKTRLAHVIGLTEDAAHRTLDLVERSGPLAERTARQAAALLGSLQPLRDRAGPGSGIESLVRPVEEFLSAARSDAEQIRRNLADVLLAQGYQDLTGQIIRNVMTLVQELEQALASLTRLSDDVVEHASLGESADAARGPTVPGVTRGEVAAAQTDVDDLLSDLGM